MPRSETAYCRALMLFCLRASPPYTLEHDPRLNSYELVSIAMSAAAAGLPKITKKQAIEIINKATSFIGATACLFERATSSEDYWAVIRFFNPKADVVNRLLNEWARPGSAKASSSSKKKASGSKKKRTANEQKAKCFGP